MPSSPRKPRAPKLLCDENIPRKLTELLARDDFRVIRSPIGLKDEKVAELAKAEGRVLVTFDRHFSNVKRFPPEMYAGIVFVRISPPLINITLAALRNLFHVVAPKEFHGKLITLTPFGYRMYPRRFGDSSSRTRYG